MNIELLLVADPADSLSVLVWKHDCGSPYRNQMDLSGPLFHERCDMQPNMDDDQKRQCNSEEWGDPDEAPSTPSKSVQHRLKDWVESQTFVPDWWRHSRFGILWTCVAALVIQTGAVGIAIIVLQVSPEFRFPEALLLLPILVMSLKWGQVPGLVAAVLNVIVAGALAWSTEPALALSRQEDIPAVFLLLIIGVFVSYVAGQAEFARRKVALMNVRMEQFLHLASHELRTPLASTRMTVQLAERLLMRDTDGHTPGDTRDRVEYLLRKSQRELTHMNRLVEDLLDASRAETGQLEIRLEDHDIVAVTRDAIEEMRDVHPAREILFVGGDNPIWTYIDEQRIRQVLTNFISNALKYSDEKYPVRVQVDEQVQGVRVAVTDHGPGLTSEQQQRIWYRGYRVPGVVAHEPGAANLGLGLYLSRTLVERHGGSVGVASEQGKGSTFWFVVPLATRVDESRPLQSVQCETPRSRHSAE